MRKFRKSSLIILCLILFFSLTSAEQTDTEKLIMAKLPYAKKEKNKLEFSSYYEYSWINQGSRKVHWRVSTSRLAYLNNQNRTPYLEVTYSDRVGLDDYTFDLGSYFRFKNAYAQAEIGAGADVDYVYKFQTTLEYAHRLFKNYFGKLGYRYLKYRTGDVYIATPGLVYYFGDHYLSADYGVSSTDNRGSAQWGSVKGNFALNKRLHVWLGTAVGERLYDIYTLSASEQYSYIIFIGTDFSLFKDISFRLGYSYSRERPSFIKRSLDFGLSFKF